MSEARRADSNEAPLEQLQVHFTGDIHGFIFALFFAPLMLRNNPRVFCRRVDSVEESNYGLRQEQGITLRSRRRPAGRRGTRHQ